MTDSLPQKIEGLLVQFAPKTASSSDGWWLKFAAAARAGGQPSTYEGLSMSEKPSSATPHEPALLVAAFETAVEAAMHKLATPANHFHVEDLRARLIKALVSETTRWIPVSERLPEVALGDEELLWVCALRKHNGKKYVFALHWVNRPHTEGDDSEHDWEISNEDGVPMNCVGWHKVGCNSNYDKFFMAVESPEEIIAWMPMTKPEAA